MVNYAWTLTVGAPSGSTGHGVSTGRANVGWNNHIEHSFDRLTPFVEAGFSNGLTDTAFSIVRTSRWDLSVSSLAGALLISAVTSAWAQVFTMCFLPGQNMFSKLVAKNSTTVAGSGQHGRGYELAHETTGNASDKGQRRFNVGRVFSRRFRFPDRIHAQRSPGAEHCCLQCRSQSGQVDEECEQILATTGY